MKAGPIALMIGLLALGVWLVVGPQVMQSHPNATPGAVVSTIDLGARKIRYERLQADSGAIYRFLTVAPDLPREPLSRDAFWSAVGAAEGAGQRRPWVMAALNITSWWNVGWVLLGLAGQCAFFGRMLIQWVTSEREKKSVVPPLFWWLSLAGGVALFAYFVWRKDVVGVMGQSTGVVIYARNIRLIYKNRRREARQAAREAGAPGPNHA